MKKLFKRIRRWWRIRRRKHFPTYSYAEDRSTQEIIKSAFDTCTFLSI